MKPCKLTWPVLILMQATLQSSRLLSQCAMCRTALTSSPEGLRLAGAFNDGILFLLCVPLLILAAFGWLLYRRVE